MTTHAESFLCWVSTRSNLLWAANRHRRATSGTAQECRHLGGDVAHHWKTGQLGSAAGRRRPYAPLGEEARRGRALVPCILGLVVVLSVLSFAVSTSPASAATPTRSTATAEWS